MGFTAFFTPSVPSSGASTLLSSLGVATGGVFVTALLIYLLAYLNVVEASETSRRGLQTLLATASIPLGIVFVAIVVSETASVIDFF